MSSRLIYPMLAIILAAGACKKEEPKVSARSAAPTGGAGDAKKGDGQCAALDADTLRLAGLGAVKAEQLQISRGASSLQGTTDDDGRVLVQLTIENKKSSNENLKGNYALYAICMRAEKDWLNPGEGNVCQRGRIDTMVPGQFFDPSIEIKDDRLQGDVYTGVTTCLDAGRRKSQHACQPKWDMIPGHISIPADEKIRRIRQAMADNRRKRAKISEGLVPHAQWFIDNFRPSKGGERQQQDHEQALLTAAYNIRDNPSAAREMAGSQAVKDAVASYEASGGAQLADGTGEYPCLDKKDLNPQPPPGGTSGGAATGSTPPGSQNPNGNSPLAGSGSATGLPPAGGSSLPPLGGSDDSDGGGDGATGSTLPPANRGTELPAPDSTTDGADDATTDGTDASGGGSGGGSGSDNGGGSGGGGGATDGGGSAGDDSTVPSRLAKIDPTKLTVAGTGEPVYIRTHLTKPIPYDENVFDDNDPKENRAPYLLDRPVCLTGIQAQGGGVISGIKAISAPCQSHLHKNATVDAQQIRFRSVQESFVDGDDVYAAQYYQLLLHKTDDGAANCLRIHEDDSDPANPKFELMQATCLSYDQADGETVDVSQLFEIRNGTGAKEGRIQIADLGGNLAKCIEMDFGSTAAPFLAVTASANAATGVGALSVGDCSATTESQWLRRTTQPESVTRPPAQASSENPKPWNADGWGKGDHTKNAKSLGFWIGVTGLGMMVGAMIAGGAHRTGAVGDNKNWLAKADGKGFTWRGGIFYAGAAMLALGALMYVIGDLLLAEDPNDPRRVWSRKLDEAGAKHDELMTVYDKLAAKEAELVHGATP